MDVEEAGTAGPRVPEAVADSGRRGDVGAWADSNDLVLDRELELAFEDEERVDFVGMDVRRDGVELGLAGHLDHLELVSFRLDDEVAVLPGNRLACAGA